MDLLVIVVFLLPMLFKMSGCEVTLRVSEQAVQWDEVRNRCRTEDVKDGCLPTGSRDTWTFPGGLGPNVSVWIEARFFYKLVWAAGSPGESDVLPYEGCFQRQITKRDNRTSGAIVPYLCYTECSLLKADIYTQGRDCYCVKASAAGTSVFPPTYCETFTQDTWNYSGKADIYSVYKIPRNLIFKNGFYKWSCFRAVSVSGSLHISGGNCYDSLPAICIGRDHQQLQNLNVSGNFSHVEELCKNANQRLPSITPHRDGDGRLQTLLGQLRNMEFINKTFYVDITRKSFVFWMNGNIFSHNVGRDEQQSECIVLTKDSDNGIRFETRPCGDPKHYICSCPQQTHGVTKDNEQRGQTPTQNEIVIAIAAGVTGAVLLAIFIIVAVVLYCMKRSGKLRGRKSSSITQSSSRSGEWDQGEASRTWDRSSRSTGIDYIDSKITPLVGNKSALPAIYENSESVGRSSANTAGNGNTDAQNLYDVCGSPDGAENGDHSSRSSSIDYKYTKLTPLVGNKSALPAIYENSESVGRSSANTAGNGNTDAKNLYDVCGSSDGSENGYHYEPMVLPAADYAGSETESQKPKRCVRN